MLAFPGQESPNSALTSSLAALSDAERKQLMDSIGTGGAGGMYMLTVRGHSTATLTHLLLWVWHRQEWSTVTASLFASRQRPRLSRVCLHRTSCCACTCGAIVCKWSSRSPIPRRCVGNIVDEPLLMATTPTPLRARSDCTSRFPPNSCPSLSGGAARWVGP